MGAAKALIVTCVCKCTCLEFLSAIVRLETCAYLQGVWSILIMSEAEIKDSSPC